MIKPVGDKILLRGLTDEEASAPTASGIFLPDSIKKETEFNVVAIGPEVTKVAVGEVIMIQQMSYKEKLQNGFFIIKEADVIAIITE